MELFCELVETVESIVRPIGILTLRIVFVKIKFWRNKKNGNKRKIANFAVGKQY